MPESQFSREVNQQFLRRTPVKLRQFSRLLDDMLVQTIDPLRVKALVSQVNKTREACLAQDFESTATLLTQLQKQLSLSDDSLETQRPLLKRLSNKLQEHSQKLELGVRPEKASTKAKSIEPVRETPTQQTPPEQTPIENEADAKPETADDSLEEQGIFLDKGNIVFVSAKGNYYQMLSEQLTSLGVEVKNYTNLAQAQEFAAQNSGSVIVAPLSEAENNEQLADDDTEAKRLPLLFTAEEDNQENRLLALRSGGTGFMVEPMSLTGLLEYIEKRYDVHSDSPYRILIMEDSRAQARFYEKVLSKGHFEIRVVSDPTILLEALRGFEPETVLMDMQMPTCTGIELTRIIRQMPPFSHLPIIFLSAEENARKQNQALLAGGTAFIVKPVDKEQLMFMAELYTKRHRELNPQIGINPDTGLVYSTEFKQNIAVEAARMSRNGNHSAMAIIQLDQVADLIKSANYSLINVAIQQLSLLLKKRLRKTDIMGHLDSGQLGVILTSGKKSDWLLIFEEIRVHFAELPFHLQHQDKPMSVSIGLGIMSSNWDAHQWFESAQQSLEQALAAGGDNLKYNEPGSY